MGGGGVSKFFPLGEILVEGCLMSRKANRHSQKLVSLVKIGGITTSEGRFD